MKITVKADLFCAAARFTSNEETRYYLHGIFFEPHPSGGVTMAATDGIRLFAAYDETAEAEDLPAAGVIIKPPKQKMPAKWFDAEGSVTLHNNLARLTTFTRGSWFEDVAAAPVIDASFPDWRRVIPSTFSGNLEGRAYNARYLMDFQEIGERLSGGKSDRSFILTHNGAEPALVRFYGRDDCMGILMPLRVDQTDPETSKRPWWLSVRPPITSEAA